MESIHQDYDNSMEHASDKQLIPPSSPDINDIVGAPQLDPRLGHEYQVEVPPMMNESERLQLRKNPANSENSYPFVFGLSVPTIWVCNEVKDSGLEDNDGTINVSVPAEAADAKRSSISEDGKELRPTTSQSVVTADNKGGQPGKSKDYVMAPGTAINSWSDSDVNSLVLGLFIFGKNFIQIKDFLETKGIGDILSFYYGKFYKSDEHRRWTRCKKMKGKKCMTGNKLFTGQRQHELLSRLNRHVSEEVQDTLQQISKSYMEGTTSLEEYISSLKSTVGLGVLVDAVGIGKRKEDLTSLSVESSKNNQAFSIPTSKALSSLGPSDIVKILTGGFRLSKAKSNDLFWEAVWPRLLARGWHSELPNNQGQGYIGSKEFLVFLIPGVKKFSRRQLVKGDHYFASVSDVLNKVVAEPNLLELEGEEAKFGSGNDEETENRLDESDQSDHRRHCYLKPRASTNNTGAMKFMVIDTSLVNGGKSSDLRELKPIPGDSVGKIAEDYSTITYNKGDKHISKANSSKGSLDSKKSTPLTVVDTSFPDEGNLSKVRELRYPPVELVDTSKMTGISGESDRSSSDDNSSSEREASVLLCGKKNIRNVDCQKDTHNCDATSRKEAHDSNQDDSAKRVAKSCQDQKNGLPDGNQLKSTVKHQFCRRARSNLAVHPIKRRRLTACVKSETSRMLENSLGGLRSEKPGVSRTPSCTDANKNAGDPVSHEQNVGSVSSSAEGSAEENSKGSIDKGISCDKVEKCESKPLISSDAPHVPPKSEEGETIAMVVKDEEWQKPNDTRPFCDVEMPPATSCDVDSAEEKADTVPRRQSTRNRPLTVRALECIANEYLHVKSRQKRKGIQKAKDPLNTRRRDHTGGKTMPNHHSFDQGTTIPTEENHLNGDFSGNENTASL